MRSQLGLIIGVVSHFSRVQFRALWCLRGDKVGSIENGTCPHPLDMLYDHQTSKLKNIRSKIKCNEEAHLNQGVSN